MKKLILILMLIAGFAGAATIQSTGGGSTAIVSGTTPITGGADTQVCFNDAGTLSCGDAGCVFNKTTNTITCNTFAGALTGNASTATALAGGAADQVMVQTGAGAGTFRTLPTSVQNGPPVTATVTYDSNTDLFSTREGMANAAISGRQSSYSAMQNVAATTLIGVGEANPGNVGTSAVYAADASTFARQYIKMTTKSSSPASGDAAGYGRGSAALAQTTLLPKWAARIATPATITSMKIWCGFMGADIDGNSSSDTNIGTRVAAFVYDTGGAANTANWHVMMCNGSGGANTCTATDTTVAVQASHEMLMVLEFTATNALYWRITDVTTSTTNTGGPLSVNPPVGVFGWQVSAVTLTGAQREVWINSTSLEQN